ncbi:MAG TPA: VWA domain-containing protein [Blastocatellia bacterium]|nr:VWA domain-containing protein [Blastocatellia bacterium]
MTVITLLTALTLLLPAIWQQTPVSNVSSRDENAIRLNARLVNLNIKVVDPAGRPVPQLTREDFVVLEDNVPQAVTYFQPVAAPVNLVLLLDLSGSIGSKLQAMKKAARKFVDSLGRDDRVAVATFTTRFQAVSDFTTDKGLLKKRIDSIVNPGGDTALYDAAWSALDSLGGTANARSALVILTDGVDSAFIPDEHGSKHGFDELLTRVEEEDATIYPIYFDTEPKVVGGAYTPQVFAKARKQLETLAEQTGGSYFRASRAEDLDGVYKSVAAELHSFYSLAYPAKDATNDGRWRKIAIKVNRAGVRARTKRGYYAR